MTATDTNGDGATLTGIGDPAGSQGAYLAQHNGCAGTLSGTTFAEVINSVVAGSYATSTASASVPAVGLQSIGSLVSHISVLASFSLTANDQASGTSTFVVVQRPVATEPAIWSKIKALF